jgi:hypothetical protein
MSHTNGNKPTSDFELLDEIDQSLHRARALSTVGIDATETYQGESPGEDLNLFLFVLRDEICKAALALSEFRNRNSERAQLSSVPTEQHHA